MGTSFREPAPVVDKPEGGERNFNNYHEQNVEEMRPAEDEQDVLEALGALEDVKVIPPEDYEDLRELKNYLKSYMEEKGLSQTIHGMQKGIESLKEEFGLHKEADPQAVIKRIGGIARSWKELSFVRDLDERKKILVKLTGASSQREMDKIIFEEMEARSIWRQ
jgi:hypothetical protein